MINTKLLTPRNVAVVGLMSLAFSWLAAKIYKSTQGGA